MSDGTCCKNIRGIQRLGLVSFIKTRTTFNNHIFLQIKLEDQMLINFKQIDDGDFELMLSVDIITNQKVKVSYIASYKYAVGDISKA